MADHDRTFRGELSIWVAEPDGDEWNLHAVPQAQGGRDELERVLNEAVQGVLRQYDDRARDG